MQRRGETILLTGPPLSGKTSRAVLWAEGRERLTSWIDWDQLTGTLFSTRLRQEPAMISDHYRFSAKIIAATARMINEFGRRLRDRGCPRSGESDRPARVGGRLDELDLLDPITVSLFPSVETRLTRWRDNPGHPFTEEQVRSSHVHAWTRGATTRAPASSTRPT